MIGSPSREKCLEEHKGNRWGRGGELRKGQGLLMRRYKAENRKGQVVLNRRQRKTAPKDIYDLESGGQRYDAVEGRRHPLDMHCCMKACDVVFVDESTIIESTCELAEGISVPKPLVGTSHQWSESLQE